VTPVRGTIWPAAAPGGPLARVVVHRCICGPVRSPRPTTIASHARSSGRSPFAGKGTSSWYERGLPTKAWSFCRRWAWPASRMGFASRECLHPQIESEQRGDPAGEHDREIRQLPAFAAAVVRSVDACRIGDFPLGQGEPQPRVPELLTDLTQPSLGAPGAGVVLPICCGHAAQSVSNGSPAACPALNPAVRTAGPEEATALPPPAPAQ
jgi:hypothetical protein